MNDGAKLFVLLENLPFILCKFYDNVDGTYCKLIEYKTREIRCVSCEGNIKYCRVTEEDLDF